MAANIFTGERFLPDINNPELEIEHLQRYYAVQNIVSGLDVLDAACGEGYGSEILAQKAKSVTGIDVDRDTIEEAKKKYASVKNLSFFQGNIRKLSMINTASMDAVISFETIEHVDTDLQKDFLSEIRRVLKPNGFLIMSTPNKKEYSDRFKYENKFHIAEFYIDQFVEFLQGTFLNVRLYDQYLEVGSFISQADSDQQTVTFIKDSKKYNPVGKYVIAVASNAPLPSQGICSVFLHHEETYLPKVERIVQLQEEVEQRNEHLKLLDSQLEQKDKRIIQLQGEIEEKNEHIKRLNEKVDEKNEQLLQLKEKNQQTEKLSQDIVNLQQTIAVQEQLIRNKEGHIEQLLEVEREYEREKQSRTYRLALKFRKASLWLFPIGSKRRFLAKVIGRTIRHPIYMLKLVNVRRIKNGITILKTEGGESAATHLQLVEEYEKSAKVPLPENSQMIIEDMEMKKSLKDYEKLVFQQWDDPIVSIIIPVYNQFDYTYHCLCSILKNSGDIKYEIILANDCSDDLTCNIDEIVEGITVINNENNLRFLLNCNHAAEYARGKYILFLNNDTQVQNNWLSPLVQLLDREESIGMVGSKLIYQDGYLQEAGGILWKDASAWNYGNRQNPNDSEFNYVREVDYISGAAIMIRAGLWKEIGGFDTRYVPAYCEDSDLAFEVRKHGFKVVYQPLSVVMHFEGISNGTDLTQGQKKYQIENQKKFYEKWEDVLTKEHFENGKDVFLARDRSRDRKHVLVIDHYVPQYDKDAGSRTMFMYLKLLLNKGYHITFLGDNFYPHEPYTTELQQMGVFVLHGPKYAENWKQWLLDNIVYFDVFYLNRPHITIKYIDLIKEYGRGKILYYGVDLHFLRVRREGELNGDKSLLKQSEEWLEKELYIMHKTDMNYYPSISEVEEVHKLDPSIPAKTMTAYAYEKFRNVRYKAEERNGLLFVGGFGHGPNLDAVMWFLEEIFPEVYEKTGASFYIVGSNPPEKITRLKMEGVVVKGFVSDEELEKLYDSCRIAVMPLRFGAGVKGKILEALYFGIPTITTSIGAEGIPDIEDVIVVKDTAEELKNAIVTTYANSDLLVTMSERSQEYVRKHFSFDAVWNVIKEDFN